ncbi:hypothetical protein [Deinococcus humi]|uniref:Uncharacterized protein n=1 Tax=Deinococcus humi TaxID=662880 RepID=A0A7W8JYR9_9DEIO|nr:hypothetical protein [Deinococcus humi]MBB5365690.1 hypothetical protein [Deinococcus humi]GGO37139.1 hypothetical protein GCM10008949_41970 [Deinococcus humi]
MTRSLAERGRLGGQATAQRHGAVHMEAIGREDFRVTVERYYGGDSKTYMAALRERQQKGKPDPRLGCQVYRPPSPAIH